MYAIQLPNDCVGNFTKPLCIWLYHIRLCSIFLACFESFFLEDLKGIITNGILISKKPIKRTVRDVKVIMRIMAIIRGLIL